MSTIKKVELRQPLFILLLLISVVVILYYASSFLIPLVYGGLFAFLVNPIHSRMVNLGLNKYISAILSTLLILVFVAGLLSALGWQTQELTTQADQIKKELIQLQQQVQQSIKEWFGISFNQQEAYSEKAINKLQDNIGSFLGGTANILSNFLLSLIYTILLLSERQRISTFFVRLFSDKEKANETIQQTSKVTQSYLTGKLIIIGILAGIYSIGFLIAGIPYAILLAVLAAFLSFIPYAGNLVGGAIAALITLATGGTITEVLLILGIMAAAQLIESYLLSPWIVGSNVNLNPLFSILAVVGFSVLWGAAGAVIALPLAGIIKILLDHTQTYEDLGYLMGDGD